MKCITKNQAPRAMKEGYPQVYKRLDTLYEIYVMFMGMHTGVVVYSNHPEFPIGLCMSNWTSCKTKDSWQLHTFNFEVVNDTLEA